MEIARSPAGPPPVWARIGEKVCRVQQLVRYMKERYRKPMGFQIKLIEETDTQKRHGKLP